MSSRLLACLLSAVALGQTSCGSGGAGSSDAGAPASSCVTGLALDCKPLFDPPSYARIFSDILQPNCAVGMGTCHTPDAAMAGLVLQDADQAYSLLLGENGGRVRVVPGDPSCSLLMIRLESGIPTFRMPPGPTPLPESARCDIVQWIANGAAR